MNTPVDICETLDYIYDVYSPVLYSIALQISSNEHEAGKILVATFKKINKSKFYKQQNSSLCVKLIKLTIETACQLFPKHKARTLELKEFSQSSVLSGLICENLNTQTLCLKYNLTILQLMKRLRAELAAMANVKKKYLVRIVKPVDI